MTAVAFAVGTWLCGVLLLSVMKDPAVRWTVACGAGAALAALAAMWSYGFANGDARTNPEPAEEGTTQASGTRSVAIRGRNTGTISTGDTHGPPGPRLSAPSPPPAAGTPRGAAAASAERSVAIGGDNHGTVSTGDTSDESAR
ncbi:hypothetical protein ACFS5L_01540 [Streptomyces phyllanthi]|uniref:hypothetical protein n=1 Tax=Streptomyces phyllanthi TaxID=1803180 RepID=UPI00128B677B|nr:hypothetical protein [Streptomyces phyllanthi]